MTHPIDIMVIAPCANGRVHPETDELVAFGRRLQALRAGAIGVCIVGGDVNVAAREIAQRHSVPVTAIQAAGFSHYLSEPYVAVLTEEIEAVKPAFVCAPHTSQGWEWAPAVAARIGAGCICGVDGITECQGRLCFQKELYGGKVKGLFSVSTTTTVISVMPGIFTIKPAPPPCPPGPVTYKEAAWRPAQTRYVGTRQAGVDASDITAAPIIVAVGNGIGSPENIALANRLARRLPKAAVAGTRVVCDRGWLGYDRQVGISGASVAPALYIACGISGASQHVMGMRGARFVIAINTDPRAPIFNEADICIVEDIIRFIPLIEEACGRLAEGTKEAIDVR
ncbi:MAG: electron transfer flavoprotein alpha subunit [Thermodesulfobacteriota bacterium]|nr:electron transfer flavoprotein alpha subunit [Thermodesulfobacteriota bacterium]